MNRREFTAALGALSGAAVLPASAMQAASASAAVVAPATYNWAQLIVRAQAGASPAMLARHLRLSSEAAQHLFDTLVRDGILRTSGMTGIARAAQPLQATGHNATTPAALQKRMTRLLKPTNQSRPLVKQDQQTLMCSDTVDKDADHACPPEPVQESPQSG